MSLTEDSAFTARLESLLREAEAVRANTRRDGDEQHPLGPRAIRTRTAIIAAGIEIFCERGYAFSTVPDIHRRAGVSLGTYYQYFRDKTDLITTIVADTVLASAEQIFQTFDHTAGRHGVTEVIDGFVRHYAATSDFQRVWEEVTLLEPTVAEFRRRLGELLELSLADAIGRGQQTSAIDAGLDPRLTARALAAMADRTCFLTFVVDGRGRRAVPEVRTSLSHLWANALQLDPTP